MSAEREEKTVEQHPEPGTQLPGPSAVDRLPSKGLLSFYDRLRDRLVSFLDKKGGKLGEEASAALLLVPDIFMLLARLSIDRQVPPATRALIGGTLAYFVLPADFLPELALGPVGFLDDLVLGVLVLSHSFSKELEPIAAKHWSGSEKLHKVIRDVLQSASSLVGNKVYRRLEDFLAKQGIVLDDPPAEEPAAEGDPGTVVY